MSILGNILWLVFGGILVALEYFVGGIMLCLTIVGIPFGIQCFKLAGLALFPFGREVVTRPCGMSVLAVIMNIVWFVLFGVVLAVSHLAFALLFAVTIIGIPFAVQHVKLARLAFTPFGLSTV